MHVSRTNPTTKARGKKTAAVKFDKAKYRKLVADALPALVETEEENERLLAIVESMMHRELSPEEAKLFKLLVKLIEDFEEQAYPIPEAPPHAVLRMLMEEHDLKQTDLASMLGGRARVAEVLAGKREINRTQAQALAKLFHVAPEVFR